MTIDADVLAVHRRTLFAMVAPQAEERGVGIAVFERVMEVVAGSGAWDAVIVALQRRGLWPPPAVQRPRYRMAATIRRRTAVHRRYSRKRS